VYFRFDQDARDAEDHLGILVNGAPPDEDDEAAGDWDPLAGEGGIDYHMFNTWKVRGVLEGLGDWDPLAGEGEIDYHTFNTWKIRGVLEGLGD
jgi:hypothetical protein